MGGRIFSTNFKAAVTIAMLAVAATFDTYAAGSDSFRIRQIYSNQSGDRQLIELEETAGHHGADGFAGVTIVVTNRHGVAKTFTFPGNLPGPQTSGRRVLLTALGTGFPNYVRPDYYFPPQFLPTDGGTIQLAGHDRWSFESLPTDGFRPLFRGVPCNCEDDTARNFAGHFYDVGSDRIRIHEYYHATSDHYFVTGSQPDIDALDSGRFPGWKRTGGRFWATSIEYLLWDDFWTPAAAACRFYIPPEHGDSHFISAFAEECDAVARRHPTFVLETRVAFYAGLPDNVSGECPSYASVPVYRLWNGRGNANHRYTTNRDERARMIALGWIPEGYGADGVAMCTPPDQQ